MTEAKAEAGVILVFRHTLVILFVRRIFGNRYYTEGT